MVHDEGGGKAVQAARKTPPRPQFLRSTLIQLMLLLIGAPVVYFLSGVSSMVSLSSGALCALVPQAYFAMRMRLAAKRSAYHAARAGLAAEGGKFVLSAASFALVFAALQPAKPGLVFLGFGVFWVIQIIDGILLLKRSR